MKIEKLDPEHSWSHVVRCVCGKCDLLIKDPQVICGDCGQTFSVFRGILDFRLATLDLSAGFDIAKDHVLATKLAEILDITSTFNELLESWKILSKMLSQGEDIRNIEPSEFLRCYSIKPVPMRHDQFAHGYAILEKIPQYLDGLSHKLRRGIALEDGAGHGLFIDAFSSHFQHVYVVDLSLAYLILAKGILIERGISNVTLVCASVERLPFADESFDFVHSNNVIEHVSNQVALFTEAKRTLKINGLFFLLSPNRFSLYFEPHFRLLGFGFIPESIRRRIIWATQNRDIDTIGLRSLGELRALATNAFCVAPYISFIPRRLSVTATGGLGRTILITLLNSRLFGGVTNFLINRALLGVMPYHAVISVKK